MPLASEALPSIQQIAVLLVGAHAFNDVGFYLTHRLLHSKALYKTFHKKHHTFRGSVNESIFVCMFSCWVFVNPIFFSEHSSPTDRCLCFVLLKVGIAAEFANPVEIILSNQIPTIGLVLAMGAHPLVQAAWLVLRLSQTYEVHSGFAFDASLAGSVGLAACGASFHDHHHTVNMGNFGAEHMDWLFGTMDHWVRDGRERGYLEKRRADGEKAAAAKTQ
jgi:methylsterol monooxygenase